MTARRRRMVAAAAISALGWAWVIPTVPVAGAAPAGAGPLAGGGTAGHGAFVTYGDQDTVIEGGTLAPPDVAAPTAEAVIDLTGLGSALAAPGYSRYSDAAGVLNAFGGTELPLSSIGDRSRAKVTGRPPQESAIALVGSTGRARARLVDGPRAEAWTSLASAQTPPPLNVTALAGEIRATVTTVTGAADSTVVVILRQVRIGGGLHIDSVMLSAAALADGAAGRAAATVVVEGATLAGTPVRLTPQGFEPVGAHPPDLATLHAAGVEIVSAGEAVTRPDGRQAEARATGPRLRLRSSDGRVVTVVLGEATASSTWVPRQG